VKPTTELLVERTAFKGIIGQALGPRARIKLDAEGWPFVPGQLGRLEWRGPDPAGARRVYAFTDRARMIAKLCAVPGVHRWQIGETEAAVWIDAEDQATLQAVAQVLHTRIRREPRPMTEAQRDGLARGRAQREANADAEMADESKAFGANAATVQGSEA
jgi:hypothetical protein